MNTFTRPKKFAVTDRSAFVNKVLIYFGVALLFAAAGAYGGSLLFAANPALMANPFVMYGSFAVTLLLVFTTHLWGDKMPLGYVLFTVFALISGFSTAPLLMIVGATAGIGLIFKALISSTCVFVAAAIYGSVTKRDISSWGGMLMVGIIGVLVVGLMNIFVGSSLLEIVLSSISILIFTGFTAYDMQMIKHHYADNMYILAAIGLFINFMGLFRNILYLLWSFSQE